MHCTLPTSSTGSECSSSSSHELQPETGPSDGGIIGMASARMPFGVMWWLRKWSSHIWCWSVISRSVSRKAASHTFTRALSLGETEKPLARTARLLSRSEITVVYAPLNHTLHHRRNTLPDYFATFNQITVHVQCLHTPREETQNTMSRDPVWPIKWFDFLVFSG